MRIDTLASRQFGLFTYQQALGNMTLRALERGTQPGRRWERVAPHVYRVLATPADWRQPLMAALLWAGEPAVLSHRSAAAVLGLDGVERGWVEFSTTKSTRPPNRWIRYQRAVRAAEAVGPLRVNTGVRTLHDLAEVLDDDRLEWVLESALRARLVSLDELTGASAGLGRVLVRRPRGAPPTGSILETRFLQLARTVDVPPLERQLRVEVNDRCRRLDLAWPEIGVFIEIDGRWHDEAAAQPYDRHRQNEVIGLLGWRPFRVGSDDIVRRSRYTARRLEDFYRRAASGAWASCEILGLRPQASGASRAMAATAR